MSQDALGGALDASKCVETLNSRFVLFLCIFSCNTRCAQDLIWAYALINCIAVPSTRRNHQQCLESAFVLLVEEVRYINTNRSSFCGCSGGSEPLFNFQPRIFSAFFSKIVLCCTALWTLYPTGVWLCNTLELVFLANKGLM